jgi:pyruvate dehydrogenase E1 component
MAQNSLTLPPPPAVPSLDVIASIIRRIQAHAMTMIYLANHRKDAQRGDPKVGGHPSAASSALQILSTLHLIVKNPQDFMAVKPHASPTDHTNNYLLRLILNKDGTRMSDEQMRIAMRNLRHYSPEGEPVFQSYHSEFDPDHWHFLPSGSVGIPPVQAVYLAHAYRMAAAQGHKIPSDAQFWCVMGDSEYREGSLMEVLPEVSERGLGNVTWIVDYNRQSLDGHRILNEAALGGKDNDRIEKTALANGWDAMQLRHGKFRKKVFENSPEGEALQNVLETALPDYEFQSLLAKRDAKTTIEALSKYDKGAQKALGGLSEKEVVHFLADLGGHDIETLREAFEVSKKESDKPMLIIAHTVKGWNLHSAAQSGNHSAMMDENEVKELRASVGLNDADLLKFERFEESTPEGQYLKARGEWVYNGIRACEDLKKQNLEQIKNDMKATGALDQFPTEVGINLKLLPYAHTQWMLGQISAKLGRIAETPLNEKDLAQGQKALSEQEKHLKVAAQMLVTMAPDVGTSTNLNASMDGRIFGPDTEDFEGEYGVKDSKTPDLVPHETAHAHHIRFDIAEGNTMSCAASYGKMGYFTGVPMMPLMTVYDFFIKRALDQLFYGCYWNSSFMLFGTPAGVTLSPEGAQHGWKSDIQIANMITWEPAFALELDWIFAESMRRHMMSFIEGPDSPNGNAGRAAVVVRCVTRALEQKELMKRLKAHKRFQGLTDDQLLDATRKDCLEGAYYVVDYRGFENYRPSENVVHIFSMGSLITEALKASDKLAQEGIFANVIQVSNADLLLGNLAVKNRYRHLRQGLGITGDVFTSLAHTSQEGSSAYPPAVFGPKALPATAAGAAQILTLGGRRIPIVSVHDGEPGLLDNIGSAVGTIQHCLAVRKHSKSGRPDDVYHYHGIDSEAVYNAAKEVMEESAYTGIQFEAPLAQALPNTQQSTGQSTSTRPQA